MKFATVFPNYDVDENGVVYKDGKIITPFKSNNYLQVLLFDCQHHRHIFGVHTVVAMKYMPDFEKGCVVHHIDGNPHNNILSNLRIYSRSEHSKLHNLGNTTLAKYIKKFGPSNKGKKMSEQFCEKCSESAKKRGFNGNQYRDKFGNLR